MKKAPTIATPPRKSEHLSLKAYPEDAKTLGELQTTRNLDSQGEAFHVLCTHFRGEVEETEQPSKCEYLSGDYCGKNAEKIKKVDANYCQACKKSQRLSQQQIDENRTNFEKALHRWLWLRDFFERVGVNVYKYHAEEEWIEQADLILGQLDAQLFELRQPSEEITSLKSELEKMAPLENDNAFLRGELQKIKRTPIVEKNIGLMLELSKKDAEIEKLKTTIGEQEKLINAYMYQQGRTTS